jgi:FecR protein
VRGYRLAISLLALVVGAGSALAESPDTTAVVRLSYVQGQVKILQGETTQFDQAHANMPLLAGYTLSTGEDGQAEVEFTDGSVARVTPNSQLRLEKLPAPGATNAGATGAGATNAGANSPDAGSEPTELTMVSGLGYFELNTGNGQHFVVHFATAVAKPVNNSILRISLDNEPELSVFVGTVRASKNGAFDQTVEEGVSLHFDANDASKVTTGAIQSDTWDQWNQDRDKQIAAQAQQQTSARETSGATSEPGWDDLDANGDWYPVEDYGDVWVPNNQPQGWDPYGNGYWANYPGSGYTWISGYSWGWLPYRCGAWNYWNSMGWGWVPGQCGVGRWPIVHIWNAPRGWRLPPRPIPGGHIGPPSAGDRLVAVNRGPALPTRDITNHHTQPVHIDGQRVDPLPVLENPTRSGSLSDGGPGTHTAPVGRSYGFAGRGDSVQLPIQPRPGNAPVMPTPRITPPVSRPMPAPRAYAPPRTYSPPPPAPHVSAPPAIGHH